MAENTCCLSVCKGHKIEDEWDNAKYTCVVFICKILHEKLRSNFLHLTKAHSKHSHQRKPFALVVCAC